MNAMEKNLGSLKSGKTLFKILTIIQGTLISYFVVASFVWRGGQLGYAVNGIGTFILYYMLFVILRSLIAIIEDLRTTV